MSRVFDAVDTNLGRHVALKILNRHYSRDSVRMASFEREAQLTAAVTHPNVVKLYSVGKDQGNFYIAMELVGGGSLEQRISEQEHLSEQETLRVGRAVAEGLRAAYREGLIHRDVKPANILFTAENTPKIVDFGLALFHERDVDDSGEIWATPYYVAPEKVSDDSEDFRSDMFSLGATLYHALTGKPPHQANTNSIQELKDIKSHRVHLEDSGLRFSLRTCELINRMLALKPEERFDSYDQLVEAFRDAESFLGYSVQSKRSRRMQLIYGVVGSAVILTLLAVLLRPAESLPVIDQAELVVDAVADPDLGSGGSTVAAGTLSVSEMFISARDTLFEGQFAKARDAFDKLIDSNKAKQPTLNWARFNAALCAMMLGKKDEALSYFRRIRDDASEAPLVTAVGSSDLRVFFFNIGGAMSNDLGLRLPPNQVSYNLNSEEAMGYLIHGLAQWHFGSPRVARDLLTTFDSSLPVKGLEWMAGYKKLLAPYMADMPLALKYGDMQNTPHVSLEIAKLDLAESKAGLAALKTQGVLRNTLSQRVRFDQSEVDRLKRVTEESERVRLASLRERELSQYADMVESLPAMVRGYDCSAAVQLLNSVKFETPEVQTALANKRYLWTTAREFMQTLMADIKAQGFTGTVPRKSSMPLQQGRISAMSYELTTVTMDRGQFSIPTDSITAEGLIAMAQAFDEKISDSTEFYRRQELIAIFAKMQGLDQMAEAVATQLMEENKAFRQRWALVEQTGF